MRAGGREEREIETEIEKSRERMSGVCIFGAFPRGTTCLPSHILLHRLLLGFPTSVVRVDRGACKSTAAFVHGLPREEQSSSCHGVSLSCQRTTVEGFTVTGVVLARRCSTSRLDEAEYHIFTGR